MKIGDLAKRAEVNIQTIRFYEREHILREPRRTPAGYRSYTEDDLQQVVFIRWCQHLGFTLKEIKKLSVLHASLKPDAPSHAATQRDMFAMACERLRGIDEKITELQGMRQNLLEWLKQKESTGPAECPAQKIPLNKNSA